MKSKMRLIFSIALIFMYYQSFAQTISYNDVKIDKPKGYYTQYIAKDGSVYKEGDTLTIGRGSSTNDNIFLFIKVLYNNGVVDYATAKFINTKAIFRGFNFTGSKTSGWKAQFTLDAGHHNTMLVIAEDAFASGELKSFRISSDDALAELKRLKDKLDLGLITQEEFNKKKVELGKYIK